MESRYGLYSQGSCGWSSLRNDEFQEEDVWSVYRDREAFTTSKESSPNITPRQFYTTAAKMIPRTNTSPSQEPKNVHLSAPVNVPNWSKIYGENPKKPFKNSPCIDDDDDDDDDDGCRMPPHEWMATRLERARKSSFSVCEGAGRTLKGRDLSRVRNAVLTRTGFLE